MSSNWEDSTQEALPGDAAVAHDHEHHDHDGHVDEFGDDNESHQHSVQEGDVVDAEPAKKKTNPLVAKALVGVLGLAAVGGLAFFGISLKDKLGGGRPAQVVKAAPKQVTELPRTGSSAVMGVVTDDKSAAPASPLVAPVSAMTPPPAAIEPPVIAAVPTTPSFVQQPVAVIQAVPVAPTVQAPPAQAMVVPAAVVPARPDPRLEQSTQRVRSLEQQNETLRNQLANAQREVQDARARPAAVSRTAGVSNAQSLTASPDGVSRSAPVQHVARAKVKKPAVVAAAEPLPPELSRLKVSGMYPPSGADMRVWLKDGDKTASYIKGDTINGARIERIDADRIVTSRGTITVR